MTVEYQVVSRQDKRQLIEFLIKEGQFLLPMFKLIEQAELAVDELIDGMGRASIEAVLELSAMEVAGSKTPGKESGELRWHGRQCQGLLPGDDPDGVVHAFSQGEPVWFHKTWPFSLICRSALLTVSVCDHGS
jgi:hypothetical protein